MEVLPLFAGIVDSGTAPLLPLTVACVESIGGAAFNNEFGRPNLGGYFRVFEQQVAGVQRGYHKPIMIAGGYGNIRPEHVEKQPIEPGDLLIVLGTFWTTKLVPLNTSDCSPRNFW